MKWLGFVFGVCLSLIPAVAFAQLPCPQSYLVYLPLDSSSISNPLVLPACHVLAGNNDTNIIYNFGSTVAVTTPASTPGGPKAWAVGTKNLTIIGSSKSLPPVAGIFVQQTAYNHFDDTKIANNQTLFDMEGSTGTFLLRPILFNGTNGIRFGGINSLDSTTLLNVFGGSLQNNMNALVLNGTAKGLSITGTDIESNTNVYTEATGSYPPGIVFRNCWIEGNTKFDIGTMVEPIFDTCRFVSQPTITGGINPVFRDIDTTESSGFGSLVTNSEVATVSASADSFKNAGQHGMALAMPLIGSASTPVDFMQGQSTSQSQLIGELAGTLFGYSQPTKNLNGTPVSQTTFAAPNYWPYNDGSSTIVIGQPDMFGGTSAVKVVGMGLPAYVGSTDIAVPISWNVIEMAFQMVNAGETVGLWAQTTSDGGTLDKRNSYVVPDTNIRVIHMYFKSDETAFRPTIQLPASGIIVHRFAVFSGHELKPLIKEGAAYRAPFIMNFQNVETWAAVAPTTGAWSVGDKVWNTAPAANRYMGWVNVVAGNPGTWKTFGAIAP